MMYEVFTEDFLIDQSVQNFDPRGAFAIAFHNKGTDNATLNNNTQLNAGDVWEYNYLPNCKIMRPYKIVFAGAAGATQSIVAILSFAKPTTK